MRQRRLKLRSVGEGAGLSTEAQINGYAPMALLQARATIVCRR